MSAYDPFNAGPFAIDTSTFTIDDATRRRTFPVAVWRPAGEERPPLIVFSPAAGQGHSSASFLCRHLASHGYTVAAMDHSERVAPELARRDGETDGQRMARWHAVIDSRVPDVRLLLDHLVGRFPSDTIGIAGHSFGGWTALASLEDDDRYRAVVALAPAGGSNPRPGILPVTLTFAWRREVPALYVAAENDASIPLASIVELFARAPSPKRLAILRRTDHLHFIDDVEATHEGFRLAPAPNEELAAMQRDMLPMSELQSGEAAHRIIRALLVAHFDAALRDRAEADEFLDREANG